MSEDVDRDRPLVSVLAPMPKMVSREDRLLVRQAQAEAALDLIHESLSEIAQIGIQLALEGEKDMIALMLAYGLGKPTQRIEQRTESYSVNIFADAANDPSLAAAIDHAISVGEADYKGRIAKERPTLPGGGRTESLASDTGASDLQAIPVSSGHTVGSGTTADH